MPFDGIDPFETHPLMKLGAVERLLATEQQWCKGRLRDAHGRHCLVGAIEAVEGRQMLQRIILQAAREVSGKRYWRIEFFNDDPRTTHADVLEVLHRARENIIAGLICDTQPWHRQWRRALRSLCSNDRSDTRAAHVPREDGYRAFLGEPLVSYRGLDCPPERDGVSGTRRAAVMELQR